MVKNMFPQKSVLTPEQEMALSKITDLESGIRESHREDREALREATTQLALIGQQIGQLVETMRDGNREDREAQKTIIRRNDEILKEVRDFKRN